MALVPHLYILCYASGCLRDKYSIRHIFAQHFISHELSHCCRAANEINFVAAPNQPDMYST